MTEQAMRRCPRCREELALDCFFASFRSGGYCKQCNKEYHRERAKRKRQDAESDSESDSDPEAPPDPGHDPGHDPGSPAPPGTQKL